MEKGKQWQSSKLHLHPLHGGWESSDGVSSSCFTIALAVAKFCSGGGWGWEDNMGKKTKIRKERQESWMLSGEWEWTFWFWLHYQTWKWVSFQEAWARAQCSLATWTAPHAKGHKIVLISSLKPTQSMKPRTRSHSETQLQIQTNCWRLLNSFSFVQARPP